MIAFHKFGKTLALTAVALFAAGITLSTPEPAQAASKTGNFLLGAAAGAAGLAIIHGLNKNRRRAAPAPRRYYRRAAPRRRYYKPRIAASPETMRIQESLNVLGYNVGSVDGRSGPATRAGARAFQMSIAQPATGYLTELQKGILFQKAQAILTGVPAARYPAPAPAAVAPAYAPPAPAALAPSAYAPRPAAAPAYAPPPPAAPAYAAPAAPAYAAPAAPAAPAYIPPPPIQPAPAQ